MFKIGTYNSKFEAKGAMQPTQRHAIQRTNATIFCMPWRRQCSQESDLTVAQSGMGRE